MYFFKRNKLLLYSLCMGLLLALSWPARGFPFLAFFAFIPMFLLEDHVLVNRKNYRSVVLLLYAWAGFFVFNLLTTWWIMYATVPGMIVAVVLNAFFMAIPWWLMHLGRRLVPGRQGSVSLIFLWLSFEFLHSRWELSWSWLDIGNVFAAYPALVQWYQAVGTAGGSLWVLTVNLLLFIALKYYLNNGYFKKISVWSLSFSVLVFAIPVIISLNIWHNHDETDHPVHVVIIQPAEDPYEEAVTNREAQERVDKMIDLADSRLTPETRFVVAPEAANPRGIWMHEADSHYAVQRIREHIAQNPGVIWVMGSFTYELFKNGASLPPEARPLANSDRHYVAYNSVVMIEGDRPLQYYHKSKLVPGIERMPYFNFLKPVGKIVDVFGGIAGSLGVQEERGVFQTANNEFVGAAVCYESIYGDFMTGYMNNLADLLFVVTNDGWWRNTPGYRQHNQYARLRAIEMRRSIARSASTGISSFINQRGEIIKSTQWWEETAIAAEINRNRKITPFAASGNFLGRMSLFISAFMLLQMFAQWLITRSKNGSGLL
jgi:apolipoprotein N-acyltransferase